MEPSQEIGRPAFVALYGGSLNSSASEGAQVAKVNGGHKLGPDLRATNEEIRHEDCGYRRQRAHRDKAREEPSLAWA